MGRISEWDATDGDFEIGFNLFFDRSRSIPMGEGEPTVNFRFGGVFRGEEIVKIFLRIDYPGVVFLKFLRAPIEIILDRH